MLAVLVESGDVLELTVILLFFLCGNNSMQRATSCIQRFLDVAYPF